MSVKRCRPSSAGIQNWTRVSERRTRKFILTQIFVQTQNGIWKCLRTLKVVCLLVEADILATKVHKHSFSKIFYLNSSFTTVDTHGQVSTLFVLSKQCRICLNRLPGRGNGRGSISWLHPACTLCSRAGILEGTSWSRSAWLVCHISPSCWARWSETYVLGHVSIRSLQLEPLHS